MLLHILMYICNNHNYILIWDAHLFMPANEARFLYGQGSAWFMTIECFLGCANLDFSSWCNAILFASINACITLYYFIGLFKIKTADLQLAQPRKRSLITRPSSLWEHETRLRWLGAAWSELVDDRGHFWVARQVLHAWLHLCSNLIATLAIPVSQ